MFLANLYRNKIVNQSPKFTTQTLILFLLIFVSISSNLYAETVQTSKNKPGVILGGKISEHPAWFKDSFLNITEDIEEADESNKHVMLFFHLNGCPYCYKMTEENLKNAPYTDFIKENFDVIALNTQGDREIELNEETSLTEKELTAKLKIIYTPAVVFLDKNNKVVARVNGYRSVEQFKHVLDYVQQNAYQTTSLAQFIARKKKNSYEFRSHPQLVQSIDLSTTNNKPLAVLFESKGCKDCMALHDDHLNNPEVMKVHQCSPLKQQYFKKVVVDVPFKLD